MKLAGIILGSVIVIFLVVHIYGFVVQEHDLAKNLSDVEARLAKAKTDENILQDESQYLANPLNLEKELRARFNYKKPGEKMIIIVPPQATSSTGTAAVSD